jgi:uncharacterized protein (TIGR03083 family)
MESSARTWIGALRGSQQRLASLVGQLSPEQLRQPSYCSDWSIAQVLSHLGSQAEIGQATLTARLHGGEPLGIDDFKKVWAVWDAKDPDEQAAQSLVQDAAQVNSYERLSDDELAGIRATLFGTEFDAVGLLWLRLGEHAVHSWDIAVSLDPGATIADDCVGLLLDRLSWLAGRAGKADGEPYQVIIETAGPRRGFLLDVGESVSLSEVAPGEEPAGGGVARIRMPGEALLRLVYGRLDAGHTPPVEILAGDVDLDRLRKTFPGF